jgi:hypothetical protein
LISTHAPKLELLARQRPDERKSLEGRYRAPVLALEDILVVAAAQALHNEPLAASDCALGSIHSTEVRLVSVRVPVAKRQRGASHRDQAATFQNAPLGDVV